MLLPFTAYVSYLYKTALACDLGEGFREHKNSNFDLIWILRLLTPGTDYSCYLYPVVIPLQSVRHMHTCVRILETIDEPCPE
jgi:hypothetical protein